MAEIRDTPTDLPTTDTLAAIRADDAAQAEAEQAYLTFGGWAKLMPAPSLHDRRRYTIDVECTAEGKKATEKGERHTRSMAILRIAEATGVTVPPRDEDENQASLFDGEDQTVDEDGADETARAEAYHEAATPAKRGRGKTAEPTPVPDNVTQFKAPGSK